MKISYAQLFQLVKFIQKLLLRTNKLSSFITHQLSGFDKRQYVKEGISHGRRPELVGGGLIRSLGGWSQVLSVRRDNQRVLTDERILGTGDFVDRILNEADERLKYQMAGNNGRQQIGEVVERVCEEENINSHELRMGSRRRRISQVRAQIVHQIVHQLVENFGIPLAEVARQVGVSASAISKALNRTMKN